MYTSEELSGSVEELLESGRIRYVDAMEAATADIALFPEDARNGRKAGTLFFYGGKKRDPPPNLLEIDAHLMLGVTATLIPIIQCNQSPRNAYQTSMGRQAIGAPMPFGSSDLSPALCYAQKPLCTAAVPGTSLEAVECGSPMGQNFVVAVCPYGGCNHRGPPILLSFSYLCSRSQRRKRVGPPSRMIPSSSTASPSSAD